MAGRIDVGCTGWGYDDWKGPFYPPGTPPSEYLARYARVFPLVEVDSSYYQAPARSLIERWVKATPDGFGFTIKLPGTITHDAKLRGIERPLDAFLDSLQPMRNAGRLRAVLAGFPPSFTREKDEEALHAFLRAWPQGDPLAVELRNASWWTEATYQALREAGATLVWSESEHGRTPPVVTSRMLYARMIGDRALTRFDRIQRDLTDDLRYWRERLVDEGAGASSTVIMLNNHFMGFAPGTVVRMHEVLGLPPPDLAAARRPLGQTSFDAFGQAR